MTRLTPIQQMHYPTILWLLNESRAQGKTYLLAYCYLINACEHLGRYYEPIDFPRPDFQYKRNLLGVIAMIAKELDIKIIIKKVDSSFCVDQIPNSYISKEISDRVKKIGK